MIHTRLAIFLFAISLTVSAQTGLSASTSGPPIHVLYRLFFRDVAALETAADKNDRAGKPGGNEVRAWYQNVLALTDAQTAVLKADAAQCNKTLDQHQIKAQPAIDAEKNKQKGGNAPITTAAASALIALEAERTDISNTCIASLHADLGDTVFATVDLFVRTKFAQKVSQTAPAGAPFGNAPVTQPKGGAK